MIYKTHLVSNLEPLTVRDLERKKRRLNASWLIKSKKFTLMKILKSILLLVSASMLALIGITLKAQADHCSSIDIFCPASHRGGGIIKVDPVPDSHGNEDPLPQRPSNSNPFTEVIRSSYLRVFGRYPSPDEINYWIGRSQQESLNMLRGRQ